ncbi:MTH1187 family thiamine-binding protein [Bacillus piscicola]|uniref:MTH1187 family thiamine-binding protein n=1 Tax=Bacillus piscicola TaxID=1632684 RepID=UPI001F08D6A7|nr:MTH1187 family thiamine-binding protein [Bacillus piscicola]
MKGLSYQNGVLFIGEQFIGWAHVENQRPVSRLLPLHPTSLWKIGKDVFLSMPYWYKLLFFLWGAAVLISVPVRLFYDGFFPYAPAYTFFYFLFGTHFIFPKQLKQFHGAEHKVFSFKGIKSGRYLSRIKKAAITNRYCSTNTVVLYFFLVAACIPLTALLLPLDRAAALVSYAAVPAAPLLHRVIQKKGMGGLRKPLLTVSYAVQKHITCSNPERIHLRTALAAYRTLARKEYPHLLKEVKEEKHMAIMDLTVVPIGSESTSMSDDVAEIQKVLDQHGDKINYQLTSMSTIIEGDLRDLLAIVQNLHEIPFNRGAKRVSTNIRIDDRRDKTSGRMEEKVESVESKL